MIRGLEFVVGVAGILGFLFLGVLVLTVGDLALDAIVAWYYKLLRREDMDES